MVVFPMAAMYENIHQFVTGSPSLARGDIPQHFPGALFVVPRSAVSRLR